MRDDTSRLTGRMPWILLGIGALAILAVLGALFVSRRSDRVNVNVANPVTPTAQAVGVPVTVVITATPPLPTTIAVTPNPPTPMQPTAVAVIPTPVPPDNASGPSGAQVAPPPPTVRSVPPAPPTQPEPPTLAPTIAPTPVGFSGEVASSGGLGNTRANLDRAYGAPTGETPSTLVVYRRALTEYQVRFSPAPSRALLVTLLQPGAAPMDLEAARTAVQPLFPTDAERRSTQPEGNDDFVVERYRSATLARAIPEDVQASWGGQSGNFLVIYGRSRDTGGRIDRVIIAIGDNVDLARQRGQQ